MKTMKIWYWPLMVLLVANVGQTIAQTPTVHDITLQVNTSHFDRHNPTASCQLVAGEGTQILVSSPVEEFTIAAEVGDTIRWNGISTTQADATIQIRKIKYERGVNIFPFDEKDGDTIVEGTITKGKHGEDYKYVISFKINGTGPMYHIDPKIQVK